MKFLQKSFLVMVVLSLFFISSVSLVCGEEFFVKSGNAIVVPEGSVATGFTAEININSGKTGIDSYNWGWKIVNTDNSTSYQYWDRPYKQTGSLGELVLSAGKYYLYIDRGDNKIVDINLSYSLRDDNYRRYFIPSRHHGYTVYDFDDEIYMYGSGDCGYFRVKYSDEPYFFVDTPSYIRVDDRYNSRYFDTAEGYYIFDGTEEDPILFDEDDEVIIVDEGDGQLIIVEEY